MLRVRELPLIHRVFVVSLSGARAEGDGEVDARELIGKGRMYDATISSEEPANQWYWELGLIKETLSHEKSAVVLDRLMRAGPLLWNHDRYDQRGRVHDPQVDPKSKTLKGRFRFSRTQLGQDLELDALDEIKVNVSLGYRVHEMLLSRRGDIEKGEIDEYLITKWEPYEVSIVSIPADVTVGFGRSEAEELAQRRGAGERFLAAIEDGVAVEEERTMDPKDAGGAAVADTPTPAAKPDQRGTPAVEVGTTARDKEVMEILGMCRANDLSDEKAHQFISRGLKPMEVGYEIAKEKSIVALAQPPSERVNAVPSKELGKYSLSRAILMTLPSSEGGIPWGGLEAEVHAELEKSLPISVKRNGGVLVPTNMPGPNPHLVAQAAKEMGRAYPLDSATATEGTEFKSTSQGEFIDMLRARLITVRLGARFLPGLPGPVGFPRKTAASTPTWQSAEAAAITDSMPLFELMTLSPKTLIDTTGTTRQLLRMASEPFEALLRDDILQSHKVAIDTAAFVGTGASGQPSGIYVLAGVQSYDVGPGAGANAAPDYIDITSMIGLLGDANADESDAVAFAMTPLLAATLSRTLTFAAAPAGGPIWVGKLRDGLCGGYPAAASNVLSKTLNNGVPTGGAEHGIVCANFAELFIGEWGAFEIIADPYSSKKSGVIELTSFQMVDVNARHQASFVKGINAIP